MTTAESIWNGTWSVRRDPTSVPGAPFVPVAVDLEALPAPVRAPVRSLLGALQGAGLQARFRLPLGDGTDHAAEVVVHGTAQGAEVIVTGAIDRPVPDAVTAEAPGTAVADQPGAMDAGQQRLLELAHHGVWVVDLAGRTTFANKRMAAMLGFEVADLMARPMPTLLHGADRWRVVALFDRRSTAGHELHDVRFVRADGSDLWAIVATTPLTDETGAVTGVMTVVNDITERHRRELELTEAERRFRLAFADAPNGKALVTFAGEIVEANRALGRLLGRDPEALAGTRLDSILHVEDVPAAAELVARVIDGDLDGFSLEVRFTREGGQIVWADVDASLARDDDGAPAHLVIQVDDITARKVAEHSSREAVARFQAAFTHAPIGMAIVELDGGVREANPGLCRMLDLDPDVIRALNLVDLVDPEDAAGLADQLARLREGQTNDFRAELRFSVTDGRTVWTMLSAAAVADEAGLPAYVIAQAEDVTERRVAEHDLVHQTLHDPLTGLGNRLLLKDRLATALETVGVLPFAVMFLDLDRFKSVNDTHGHDAGDALLVGVGERLRRIVRGGDTVARLGGDEFAVIAQGVHDIRSADALADKVRAALRSPFRVGNLELTTTASVGVVLGSPEYATGDQLLRDADIAMYRAKDGGRDRHELFDDDIRLAEIERLETERTLRTALAEGGLRLHYQPIIDLHTGRAVGAEALLRIAEPDGGLLSPMPFLTVAEDTRLLLDVGAWVLVEVAAQLARWADGGFGHLGIWMNVSAQELASPRFPGLVHKALTDHRIGAGRLHLECSEETLLAATPPTLAHLQALAGTGVELGIDDFGTGYSSLAYLRDLPVRFLKIDPSFTRRLDEAGGASLVEAIVSLGRSLDLAVIAEGVETRRQVEALARLGCGAAQGHLFAPPSPVDSLSLTDDAARSWP